MIKTLRTLLNISLAIVNTLKFIILNPKILNNPKFLKLYYKLSFIIQVNKDGHYHNIKINNDYYVHDLFQFGKNSIYSQSQEDPFKHILSNLKKEMFAKDYSKIIDIGANEGLFSFYFASMFPNAKVTSIEPTKMYYDRLKIFKKYFNYKNIKIVKDKMNYDNIKKSNNNLILYLGMLYHQDNVELTLDKLFASNSDILIESMFWPKDRFCKTYSLKTHNGLANPLPINQILFEEYLIANKKKFIRLNNIKLNSGYNLKNIPGFGIYSRKYYFIYS